MNDESTVLYREMKPVYLFFNDSPGEVIFLSVTIFNPFCLIISKGLPTLEKLATLNPTFILLLISGTDNCKVCTFAPPGA